MLKKIGITILVLAVFTVAAIYIFRAELKRYGLGIMLRSFPIPNVKLARIDFDKTEGKLTLEGVKVKNADGFSYPYVVEAEKVVLDVDLIMGAKPRLDVKSIDVTAPVFYVERSSGGDWNFREISGDMPSVSFKRRRGLSLIKEAYARETGGDDKPVVTVTSKIKIEDGRVRFMDRQVDPRSPVSLELGSMNGTASLFRSADGASYERLTFEGSLLVDGKPSQPVSGVLNMNLLSEKPTYSYKVVGNGINLLYFKPYIERYSPFLVYQGRFDGRTEMDAVNGATKSTYTMELTDLRFAVNPDKANIPFLETSVERLSTYLVTRRGGVVLDFRQEGDAYGNVRWGLGPVTKRAVAMAAVDTVIDVIEKGINKDALKGQDVQGVIDVFRGIFNE